MEFLDRIGEIIKKVRRAQQSGASRTEAVDAVVAKLPVGVVRGMASIYLAEEVQRADRAEALAVERQAETDSAAEAAPGIPSYRGRSKPKRFTKRWREWIQTPEGAEYEADYEYWQSKKWESLNQILTEYTDQMKMAWTAELLATEFALPDGSSVTWGDATVEDHKARQDMFMQNAHANLEGAARHEHAIRDLTNSGATCLRDLSRKAA